ncbi:hypothetical protein I551_3438 [Mycobacterium ulcerans str. Harvey]|uniref:Uncharacterized protein n=1 Tax=Mycobacterium ulcerans str. Harvey TaxID=1299332 RepID=A0ABN0QZE1_MYCUL|nr:hypothetical protein I551_3438 [Mycobacterium ulcerans str. Harvey]
MMLSEVHSPAATSNEPGPGPLLNRAECTSGGAAIQIGAVIDHRQRTDAHRCEARPTS